jgi:hypothetical protein
METFLGGEKYAECVFSASFHGSVFAILNRKPLYALQLGDGLDTRVSDLLRSLGMENRLVSADSDWENLPPTDYAAVEQKISALRNHSINFLRTNMR